MLDAYQKWPNSQEPNETVSEIVRHCSTSTSEGFLPVLHSFLTVFLGCIGLFIGKQFVRISLSAHRQRCDPSRPLCQRYESLHFRSWFRCFTYTRQLRLEFSRSSAS